MGANAGSPGSPGSAEDEDKRWRASKQAASTKGSTLTRSGSVKDLIHKFSVPDSPISPMSSPEMSPSTGPLTGKAPGAEPGGPGGVPEPSRPAAEGQEGEREKSPQRSSMPSVTVTVTPPTEESSRTDKQSETTGPSNGALAGSGTKVVSVKPLDPQDAILTGILSLHTPALDQSPHALSLPPQLHASPPTLTPPLSTNPLCIVQIGLFDSAALMNLDGISLPHELFCVIHYALDSLPRLLCKASCMSA